MVNSSTSPLSTSNKFVVKQQQEGSLMQYTAQSTQIGQKIIHILLTHRDPQTLLATIAKTLGEFFQVDVCLIMALAQHGDRPIANPGVTTQTAWWYANDFPSLSLGAQAQLLENPTLNADLDGSSVLAIRDLHVSEGSSTIDSSSEVPSIRSVLKIPTPFQSSPNGTIILGRSQAHDWTIAEQELLAIASESVAVAISQVQLTRQVLGFTRFQSLLHQLSLAMRSALNLDDILQVAIASTAQALQVSHGLILLLTHTTSVSQSRLFQPIEKTKVIVAGEWTEETAGKSTCATTSCAPSVLNQCFWLSDSYLCQQALRDAPTPLLISDTANSWASNIQAESSSIIEQAMMPALLIVPLLSSPSNAPAATNVLGFLVLQHHQPRLWQTEELEFVEGVSAQVSATIIQNQTLQQVQSLVEERTAQLQHSLEVQAKLYEKTRQQIQQLQELNRLKEEFMSSMSHELRTPLTTMSLAIRMLRQPTLPLERREKYLAILEHECNKEIELINNLLSLQRLEADRASIQPQKIDLMLLIDELTQSFEQKWADKRLTLTVESPVPSLMFNTDPDSVNRILLELLTNAGKYSDPDTTVHLQVAHQIESSVNQVMLTLSNTGPGIAPEDLTHIFDKFRRGQGVTQNAVRGTGLGLALVKCLVEHLNGSIAVSSCPLETSSASVTAFTLTLPQLQQPV
ncbi:MAG TPA: ATP-binding protein [Coleofasciculaceae cyanobacterium]